MLDTKIEDRAVEIWKDVIGYENYYQISSWGSVKSFHKYRDGQRERILKQQITKNKYKQITLHNSGQRKCMKIHRLVGLHFIDNPNNLPEINHIAGNKLNNYWEDLEWCTGEANIEHAFSAQLHNNPRKKVYCPELNKVFKSVRAASGYLGISSSDISGCCKEKTKSAGKHPCNRKSKLTWRYV
jgi:hypothetical protein